MEEHREMVTKAGVAKRYGVSTQTVTKWEQDGDLPKPVQQGAYGNGKKTLFILSEVDAYRQAAAEREIAAIKAKATPRSGYEEEAQLYGGFPDAYQANNRAIAQNPRLRVPTAAEINAQYAPPKKDEPK